MAETDVKGLICALKAIAEGYSHYAKDDRYIIVANPDFRPDDGSDVNLVIDTETLRAALSGTREAGEPVRYQRRHPSDDWGWIEVDDSDIEHYRAMGQEIRPLYTAPPAEVERGAVTDETVRLACPQCDFGIGLQQLPAALAKAGEPHEQE